MDLLYVVLLILFGVLFLVARSCCCRAYRSVPCWRWSATAAPSTSRSVCSETVGGIIAIAVVLLLSLVATIISLRAKTWQRFSLRQQIDSSSMPRPEEELHVGERGKNPLAPLAHGPLEIDGRIYEAKSLDAYVDPQREVEVVGFENFSVIVKVVK